MSLISVFLRISFMSSQELDRAILEAECSQ